MFKVVLLQLFLFRAKSKIYDDELLHLLY